MLGLVCEWPLIARADSHSTFAVNNIVISPQPVGEFYLVCLFYLFGLVRLVGLVRLDNLKI